MKILHFTNNVTDGAGKAAYQIHKNLSSLGDNSTLLVYRKNIEDDTVIQIADILSKTKKGSILNLYIRFKMFVRRFLWYKTRRIWRPKTLFNQNRKSISFNDIVPYLEKVDIICLYSIQWFLSSKLVKQIYEYTKSPIVWTLMDIEPLTGGCHFNSGCENYKYECGNCKQLERSGENDISHKIFKKKKTDYKNLPIHIVAPTTWFYEKIKKSGLFSHVPLSKIILSVDEKSFRPISKEKARKHLRIPLRKKIILFGSFDLTVERKGGKYLLEAVNLLQTKLGYSDKDMFDSIALLTIGVKNSFSVESTAIQWIHLGLVEDNKILSQIYNAVDVYACPSIDDAGPMMINEAYYCGTPVIAFDGGVAQDLINSSQEGYIAELYDVESFSDGLKKILFEKEESTTQQDPAYSKCSAEYQAIQYRDLFSSMLG